MSDDEIASKLYKLRELDGVNPRLEGHPLVAA